MKKLTILIATILIFALTMGSLAASMSDVPADHWATEAVQKLVNAGVLEGYPDGTFRGTQDMTRYEIAMAVARLLEKIEAEWAALEADVSDDVDSVQDDVDSVQDDVDSVQDDVDSVQDDVDAVQDDVDSKIADLEESQDSLASGLTLGQAEEVEALVEALIASNQPDLPEGLTEEQAEEVVGLVEKLVGEFEAEIRDIQTELEIQDKHSALRYNALLNKIAGNSDDISDIDERITAIETSPISWKAPDYNLKFEDYFVAGAGRPYLDPFDSDINDDGKDNSSDVFSGSADYLKQTITTGLTITGDNVSADLGFNAVVDDFFGADTFNIGISDVVGTITTDNFAATVKDGQKPALRSYLVDGNVALDGVVAEYNGNTYVVAVNPAGDDIIAGESAFNFMGQNINVAAGIEDLVGSGAGRNIIIGLDTTLNLAGFTVTPEFAVSDYQLQQRMLKILVEKASIGPVNDFEFNYQDDTGLVTMAETKYGFDNGYHVSGGMDILNLKAKYENYDKAGYIPVMRLDASETFMDINTSFEYDLYTADNASRMQFEADRTMNLSDNLAVTGSVNWVNMNNKAAFDTNEGLYDGNYDASKPYNSDMFDKTISATYDLGKLKTTAKLVHDINSNIAQNYTAAYTVSDALDANIELDKGATAAGFTNTFNVNYDPSDLLSTSATLVSKPGGVPMEHTYNATLTQGIITAGITKYINKSLDATELSVSVDPGAYTVSGFSLDPYASYAYRIDNSATGNYTNYDLGVDASKDISDKLAFNAGYALGQRKWNHGYSSGDKQLYGYKTAINAGLTYAISDDVSANFNYDNVDFDGDVVGETYEVKKVIGTINVNF